MDKLKKILFVNKRLFVFLYGIFIVSFIFGCIFPFFLSKSDMNSVSGYLHNFVSNIGNSNCFNLFYNGFLCNCGFLFLIFLLGISVIGCIVVLFLYFFKGFILGFSVSSIVFNFGFKGILLSFVYLFPHQIINFLFYTFMTCYSLGFSIKFLGYLVKKYDFNLRLCFRNCFRVFIICFIVLLLSVVYESFLWPFIFRFVCNFLHL